MAGMMTLRGKEKSLSLNAILGPNKKELHDLELVSVASFHAFLGFPKLDADLVQPPLQSVGKRVEC